MRARASKFFAVVMAAGLVFGASMKSAHADTGVALTVKQLDSKSQQSLLTAISQARAQNPAAFQKAAGIAASVPKLDKQKRGRLAVVGPLFASLGKSGLMPALEMLAVKGPARGNMTDTAWTALRAGLIEAVGMQRDPIAIPVLDAILDQEKDYFVVRAAAEALGRIGDDASAKKLVGLARTPSARQNAVLSAVGECRRAVVADGLADFLRSPTDFETTKLAVKALGGVGNSWAWQTPVVKKSGEENQVRATAAKALVDAFVRYEDPELRSSARKAILIVDDASTPKLIEAAKANASAETRAALEALAAKFAKNPLHKY